MIPYPKNYEFKPTKQRNLRKKGKKERKQNKENRSNRDGLPKIWKSLEYKVLIFISYFSPHLFCLFI